MDLTGGLNENVERVTRIWHDLQSRSAAAPELYERLEESTQSGPVDELRHLLAEAGPLHDLLSAEEQAQLLINVIRRPSEEGLECVELLLAAGCDPNGEVFFDVSDHSVTPFTVAAECARLDVMKRLMAAGADIHWSSPTGSNACSDALPVREPEERRDSPARQEVLAWLEEHGVHLDPDCEDSQEKLQWASFLPESWPEIPMLIALGVDPSPLRWTPLMLKVVTGEAGTDDVRMAPAEEIEHRDAAKRTPFLLCIAAGRRDLAELLLACGADLHAKGNRGATAMHLAARHGRAELIDWLAGLGVAVDRPDDDRHTPLQDAVMNDRVEAASRLLALGADVNADDGSGRSFIHSVSSAEMKQLLRNAGAV